MFGLYQIHYNDVIMSAMAAQITSSMIVYSTVCSGPDQRKHQSSASLAFVRGIPQWPVNSPHIGPVTWKMFPFDDVIMLKVTQINYIYNYIYDYIYIYEAITEVTTALPNTMLMFHSVVVSPLDQAQFTNKELELKHQNRFIYQHLNQHLVKKAHKWAHD